MVERFQGCKVREVDSLQLFWKAYWHLQKYSIIFVVSLCIPIILFISPLFISPETHTRIFATVILLLILFPIIFMGLLFFYPIYLSISSTNHKAWILEARGKLVAIAFFQFKHGYSNLFSINVSKNFRNQGYGSYLVRWLCIHVSKPIYAYPVFGLTDFYSKLGFSFPATEQLPVKLRSDPKAVMRYKVMLYE
jgi:GNAT superfamily N-acetyltransferase